MTGPAQATSYEINEDWSLSTKTTLTLGSSWSTQNPDKSLMTRANARKPKACAPTAPASAPSDNRLNFEKGDPISQIFKGLTDFSLDGRGQGAFVRFKYWYDHAYETGNGRFKDFDDSGWDDLSKFQGFKTLDAYVWKDFQVADHPLNVKVGNQVLSWGEALLIQNGINVINPLDISAFNRPGVEIKEGQLPVEMVSLQLRPDGQPQPRRFLPVQLAAQRTLDGCGTFFASSDAIQPGCGPLYLSQVQTDQQMQAAGLYATARGNESPSDNGQFGFALRNIIHSLNDAEAAIYYINYHSRLPYFTLNAKNTSLPGTFPGGVQAPSYAAAFPENIHLYGISLNGVEPYTGISLAGELSYRPNMPLAINAPDINVAVISGPGGSSWVDLPPGFSTTNGSRYDGWVRKGVWQMTGSATQAIDNVLGATRLSLFGEAGVVHIDDLGDERLGRNSAFGRSAPRNGTLCNTVASGVTNQYCTDKGFATEWSWGYRLRASLEYSDVLPGVNLIPAVNWRQDISGYSYDPQGPFQEGQQALGVSLTGVYMNDYSVELAYNAFFGSNDYSTLDDRDFASVSFKADF
ncbi:DUF1302 domain-containing protein [Pseudomonas sp. S2_F03]